MPLLTLTPKNRVVLFTLKKHYSLTFLTQLVLYSLREKNAAYCGLCRLEMRMGKPFAV
jgi:hypothetical protein